jgi:hypothetical protein
MANVQISFMNRSTVLTDDQVQAALPALQTQVHRDFAPVWGMDADLTFVPTNGNPALGTWWLTVFDNSDAADALGYHDLTPDGLPIGKVFAGSDVQFGQSWTVMPRLGSRRERRRTLREHWMRSAPKMSVHQKYFAAA